MLSYDLCKQVENMLNVHFMCIFKILPSFQKNLNHVAMYRRKGEWDHVLIKIQADLSLATLVNYCEFVFFSLSKLLCFL